MPKLQQNLEQVSKGLRCFSCTGIPLSMFVFVETLNLKANLGYFGSTKAKIGKEHCLEKQCDSSSMSTCGCPVGLVSFGLALLCCAAGMAACEQLECVAQQAQGSLRRWRAADKFGDFPVLVANPSSMPQEDPPQKIFKA